MALVCRRFGCENRLTPAQMSFCSLSCLREFSARRQYPGRARWSKDHREWMERMQGAAEQQADLDEPDLTDIF